jgi:CheY-like chemotaxis protein
MTRLLVVDDEPDNLELIQWYLKNEPYELTLVTDGEEALRRLDASPEDFECVLLDRKMPRLDGIEVLKRIKAEERTRLMPVIMQTGATEPEQIAEGLKLGAYYYLAKPYRREILTSILSAALDDARQQRELSDRVSDQHTALRLLTRASFELRTLPQARALAAMLAGHCNDANAVSIGLSELLINAIEHGNLAVGFEEKSKLLASGNWVQEIERRLSLPEYISRKVQVEIETRNGLLEATISDCGDGFDWQNYLEISSERAFESHGRGIAISRAVSFASLNYSGCGNVVTVTAPLLQCH